jgi:decaprenyl-phosphate phosphoribosyltransferase
MLAALFRAMRPHQWVKNLFVLAPMVFAHRLQEPATIGRALVALLAFCAAASAIYLVNDVRDREADRHHPAKKGRPLASGALSPAVAVGAAVVLAAAALVAGLFLGRTFLLLLLAYLALSLLYSWRLKHVVILDVMVLAFGYLLRVEAGAAAVGVGVSSWLLLSSRRGRRQSASTSLPGCCCARSSWRSSWPSRNDATSWCCSPAAPPTNAACCRNTARPSSTR